MQEMYGFISKGVMARESSRSQQVFSNNPSPIFDLINEICLQNPITHASCLFIFLTYVPSLCFEFDLKQIIGYTLDRRKLTSASLILNNNLIYLKMIYMKRDGNVHHEFKLIYFPSTG